MMHLLCARHSVPHFTFRKPGGFITLILQVKKEMQKSDAGLQTQAALLRDPCPSYWDLLTHLCIEEATIQLTSFPFLLAQLMSCPQHCYKLPLLVTEKSRKLLGLKPLFLIYVQPSRNPGSQHSHLKLFPPCFPDRKLRQTRAGSWPWDALGKRSVPLRLSWTQSLPPHNKGGGVPRKGRKYR